MFSLKVLKLFNSLSGLQASFDNALHLYIDSNDLDEDEFRQLTILLIYGSHNGSPIWSSSKNIIKELEKKE